jgi:hypothetical protein
MDTIKAARDDAMLQLSVLRFVPHLDHNAMILNDPATVRVLVNRVIRLGRVLRNV